jgi:Zn-dependent metalloprotease
LGNITQSTCSVIPDHIHRHVAAHGDTRQRERATSTLAQTAQFFNGRTATFAEPAVQVPAPKSRQVYDAGHNQILPGKLVMTEQRPSSSDVAAKEAFDGSGATHDFLATVFHRNSIDDRGMRLNSTVHYGRNFDNAMWNGKQMVYGDGDGKLFNRFTSCPDVIGHEFAHGVTQFTARLEYQGQSGALNEHVSDVLGIMVKQYYYGTTARRSNWYIGEGLLGNAVRGKAVRSMKAPGTAYDDPVLGKDPQPAHMKQYVSGADDNGGVHINSGIPNRAFCQAAMAIGGFAWVLVGYVWYRVVETRLSPKAQFQDFANATVAVAGELYGIGGSVQLLIAEAWSDVGLHVPVSMTRSGGVRPKRPGTAGSPANA